MTVLCRADYAVDRHRAAVVPTPRCVTDNPQISVTWFPALSRSAPDGAGGTAVHFFLDAPDADFGIKSRAGERCVRYLEHMRRTWWEPDRLELAIAVFDPPPLILPGNTIRPEHRNDGSG
jgi:hypothetical protein